MVIIKSIKDGQVIYWNGEYWTFDYKDASRLRVLHAIALIDRLKGDFGHGDVTWESV